MKTMKNLLLAAAVTGALAAFPSTSYAGSPAPDSPPSADKQGCNGKGARAGDKESCQGKDQRGKKAEKSKSSDKNKEKTACAGKDGCGGKDNPKS